MKLDLKCKFLIPVIIGVALCIGGATAIAYRVSSASIRSIITHQISHDASGLAELFRAWLHQNCSDIAHWSKLGVIQAGATGTISENTDKGIGAEMAGLLKGRPSIEGLRIADKNGDIVASSDSGNTVANVSNRACFNAALQGKTTVSNIMAGKTRHTPIMTIATPIQKAGVIVGVLYGAVNFSEFSDKFVTPLRIGKTGYAYVTNRDGLVLAHPDRRMVLNLDIRSHQFGEDMLSRKHGLIRYEFEGIDKIVAFDSDAATGWIFAVTAPVDDIFMPANHVRDILLASGAIMVVALCTIIGVMLSRFICTPLNRITGMLMDSACQVAAAAGQTAASSQTLAEGASEQAASIEDTSSSMEEMSSMTQRNAENSRHVDGLMQQASAAVTDAGNAIMQLTESMKAISSASEETSKIVKTIDEIAFQTNLLALNAAVEAARAGQAGAGFAVVADEVRNLALRAATAAQNTSGLIEGTIQRIGDGVQMVSRLDQVFSTVTRTTNEVEQLMRDISSASVEQARGIEQLSAALLEMDHVTQSVAASAEETAGTSEEMSEQAEYLRHMVSDLHVLSNGASVTLNNLIFGQRAKAGFGLKTEPIADCHPKLSGDVPLPALPL